ALFSHQVAVIMGDYLYSRAIIELIRLDDLEPLRVLARVTNEMTIGEMRQLEAHDRLAYGEAEYDQLIRAKTASLLSGACEVGARAGVCAAARPGAGPASGGGARDPGAVGRARRAARQYRVCRGEAQLARGAGPAQAAILHRRVGHRLRAGRVRALVAAALPA